MTLKSFLILIAWVSLMLSIRAQTPFPSPLGLQMGHTWEPLGVYEAEVCVAIGDLSAGTGLPIPSASDANGQRLLRNSRLAGDTMREMKRRNRIFIITPPPPPPGSPPEGDHGGITLPTHSVSMEDPNAVPPASLTNSFTCFNDVIGFGTEATGLGIGLWRIQDPILRKCHIKALLAHEAARVLQTGYFYENQGDRYRDITSENNLRFKTVEAYEMDCYLLTQPACLSAAQSANIPDMILHDEIIDLAKQNLKISKELLRIACIRFNESQVR